MKVQGVPIYQTSIFPEKNRTVPKKPWAQILRKSLISSTERKMIDAVQSFTPYEIPLKSHVVPTILRSHRRG